MELDGVELQLFHKDGDQFDLVRSAKAQFDIAAKTLYSDGAVEIIMPTASKSAAPKPAGEDQPDDDLSGGRRRAAVPYLWTCSDSCASVTNVSEEVNSVR